MDLDIVVFWLALVTVAGSFLAARGRSGWALVTGAILVAAPLVLYLAPRPGPWIVFGATAVFVVLPGMLARAATAYNLRQNYPAARAASALVALLHPLDDWPAMVGFFGAMAMLRGGQEQVARRRLQRLAERPTDLGLAAKAQLARLDGDWQGILDDPRFARANLTMLPVRLRALGESGRTGEMLGLLRDNEVVLRRAGAAMIGQGLLCAMAFGGRPQGTASLIAGPFAATPRDHQRSWLATAQVTSGGAAAADGWATLRDLSETADPATRRLAATRLARPLPEATRLGADDRALLDRLQSELIADPAPATQSRRSRNVVTLVLVAANVAVFAVEWFSGGPESDATLYQLGGLFPPAVLEGGEWWRLPAAMFLHAGVVHLAANMFGLMILGSVVEPLFGRWRTVVLYFGAGLGSMLAIVAASSLGWMRPALLVGASGAIMGLIGGLGAAALRQWLVVPSLIARQRLIRVGLALVLQTGIDLTTPRISFAAHISGTVVGFVTGWLLRARWDAPAAANAGSPLLAVGASRTRLLTLYAFVGLAIAASLWAAAYR